MVQLTPKRFRGWGLALMLLCGLAIGCHADEVDSRDWPLWERFKQAFIEDTGRVIDWTDGARTVSEGQAYALFFALVADDRETFDRLLHWTRDNLAAGDLSENLPAWLWGRNEKNGAWQILDANAATDADLFIIQALLEASRLWEAPAYARVGRAMLDQVRKRAVEEMGERRLLLPGPEGFVAEAGVRLNPSYMPPFQLRFLAHADPEGPWMAILDETLALIEQTAPRGVVADWVLATPHGYQEDPEAGTVGSYDAVRVYLWAGMNVPELGMLSGLRRALAPAAEEVSRLGLVPEHWDSVTGAHEGTGPPGFQLAMLPLLEHLNANAAVSRLEARAQEAFVGGLYGHPAHYYDQVLALFANGYRDRRFAFDRDGRLMLPWHSGRTR
ncbi:MAG: cellulase [Gammaproteobacteria bacterium]|nr:cellulase [Gammaproteobacteria bacterium]